jgi:hypothetical protein
MYFHMADSWEEADAHFESLMAVSSTRRVQLAQRVTAAGGPSLDRSVESLVPLGEWYLHAVLDEAERDDAVDYRPEWFPAPSPRFRPRPDGPRAAPGWLLLLWEQVAIYVADVVMAEVTGSRWVCWRARNPRDAYNGMPSVDVGVPVWPADVISLANAGVVAAWVSRAVPGSDRYQAHPTRMRDEVQKVLEDRSLYLAAHPPRWQAAPTGPKGARSLRVPAPQS